MYSDSAALKVHADWLGIPEAKRTRDGFFPKEALNPDTIVGLDATAAALSESHLDELIQIPPR
jgi:NitT/TauT family transport system substrate-binding protein